MEKPVFSGCSFPRRGRVDDVADLSANWRLYLLAGQHLGCDGQCHFGRIFDDISRADFFGEEFVNDNSAQLCVADYDLHRRLGHYATHFPLDDFEPDVYNLLCMYPVQRT